jgi:hypothetical protein
VAETGDIPSSEPEPHPPAAEGAAEGYRSQDAEPNGSQDAEPMGSQDVGPEPDQSTDEADAPPPSPPSGPEPHPIYRAFGVNRPS